MRAAPRAWAVLAGGLALVALAGCLLPWTRGPEEPAGPISTPFNHARHVQDEGLSCTDCHATAESGLRAGYPLLEDCLGCHEGGAGDTEQAFERELAALEDPVAWPTRNVLPEAVTFSHAAHAGRGVNCQACHGDVGSSTRVTTAMVKVDQAECASCHESQAGPSLAAGCKACHVPSVGTDYRPAGHARDWIRRHGVAVRSGFFPEHGTDCASCHREDSCNECHRTTPPESHTHNWRERSHGFAASVDREACAVCHTQDSCSRCHAETRPRNHRLGFGEPSNRHCQSCHAGGLSASSCQVCHLSAPGHDLAPKRLARDGHGARTDCATCHQTLPHPDDGGDCIRCH